MAPQPIQPTPQYPSPSGEAVVGVLVLRKPKSLGRYETYTGVVTNQRMIFAQMTNDMLTAASQQAKAQAKAEGKGFFGQWGDQLKATFGYAQRYLTMPPQTILAETPGNFAIDNNSIYEVKVKTRGDEQRQIYELEVEFKSAQGKFGYHMDQNNDFTDLLRRVYGDKVKMPFGYFSKSINLKF